MLFSSVRYAISPSLPTQRQNELAKLLDANGATMVDFAEATLIVANSLQFEGRELTSIMTEIVTDEWVDRSMVHGKLQDPKLFSADPLMIFSGVIACASDLEACDKEVISAGINALGGLFREGYTRDCTHVLAANNRSDKYMTAMHYKEATNVKVVLPHWFDDCFKLLIRLPEDPYAWPNPTAYNRGAELTKARLTPTKKALVRAAVAEDEPAERIAALVRTQTDIWHGKRILLSSHLKLERSRRQAVEASVQRAGGVPVLLSNDEVADIDSTDVYITQHRIGLPFVRAIRTNKIVGTLSWLFNVHKSGDVTSPLDQLIHFPTYPSPVSGFEKHKVTATNYEGDARRYLKKLIELMGGEFTPQMTASNTVVVAAYIQGEKTTKAREWDIPIVNHTWLEDCFAAWMLRTPAQEKYVSFPPSVNFGSLVGTRNVPPITGEELEEIESLSEAMMRKQDQDEVPPKANEAPVPVHLVIPPPTGSPPARRVLQTSSVTLNRSRTETERVDSQSTPSKPARVWAAGAASGEPVQQRSQEQREEEEEEEESPRRTKGKRARESDEENDAVPEPALPRGRPAKSASPTKRDIKSKSKSHVRAGEEDERHGKQVPVPSGRSNSGGGGEKRAAGPRMVEVDSEDEDERNRPSPVKGRVRPRVVQNEEDSDDDLPAQIEVTVASKPVSKPPPKAKVVVGTKVKPGYVRMDDDGSASSSEDGLSPIKPAKKAVASASRGKPVESQKADVLEEEEEEEENERHINTNRIRKRENAAAGPSKPRQSSPEDQKTRTPLRKRSSLPGPTPGRDVFVEVPSPASLLRSDSIVVVAADKAAGLSTPKRGRTNAKARARTPQRHGQENESPLSSEGSHSKANRLNGEAIHRSSQPTPIISIPGLQRTPSKRSAASKAAQRLHENALDINKFEKEKRAGRVRGAWEDGTVKGEESRKRRASDVQPGSDGDELGPKNKKKLKSESGSKKVRRKAVASPTVTDEEEDEAQISGEEAGLDLDDIRLLTTQVSLSEQVLKVLQKLGVKMASKPTDCNLLVANNIGRTEKFLCAMASAQYIVTEAWATDSAEAKRILSPKKYFLKDPEGEKRHKFKLADALRRAQSSEKKLLDGHTFYFTKRLFRSEKLPTYKSVISSAGGKSMVQSNPTVRVLKGHANRHVISTEGDESVTDLLVEEGFHVYTPEFILMGVLTQRMEWDTTPHRLDKK